MNDGEAIKGKRNPPWKRDELILALDLYFRHPLRTLSQSHLEIIELSEVLNRLPIHTEQPIQEKFRNPNGVYMKLCNFLRLDPTYEGKGLKSGGKLEEEIWAEFSENKKELSKIAKIITNSVSDQTTATQASQTLDLEETFPEGKVITREHKTRERNRKLVKQVKEVRKSEVGHLSCDVCKFNFFETYGSLGEDYIECHHVKPLSELSVGEKTSIKDLALVCSNCHRILHRRRPWLHPNELKELLNKKS